MDDWGDEYPSVLSSDPSERKLARTLRIQKRFQEIQINTADNDEVEITIPTQKTQSQQQIESSWIELLKLMMDGNETITNVRVASEAREVQRRAEQKQNREEILAALEQEGQQARQMLEAINKKWTPILESNDALEMHMELTKQKEKCEALLKQKDAVILELNRELDRQEAAFFKDCNMEDEAMKILAERIDAQIAMITAAYRHELTLIEQSIVDEQSQANEANQLKFDKLYDFNAREQSVHFDQQCDIVNEQQLGLYELILEHQQKFRETKMSLEDKVEGLQLDLQETKAMCLMNNERFAYNYQIVKRRQDENAIVKSLQKRRMNKLQDVIDQTKVKIDEYEETSKEKISLLTKEIETLRESLINTKNKYNHIRQLNEQQFCQIWKMNQDECFNIINDIWEVRQLIQKNIMPIDIDFLTIAELNTNEIKNLYKNYSKFKNTNENCRSNTKRVFSSRNIPLTRLDKTALKNLHKSILKAISKEVNFLTDPSLDSHIWEHYGADSNLLVRIDQILSALKVLNEMEFDILLSYFLPYAYCVLCDTQRHSGGSSTSDTSEFSSHKSTSYSPMSASIEKVNLSQLLTEALPSYSTIRKNINETSSTQSLSKNTKKLSQISLHSQSRSNSSTTRNPLAIKTQCASGHPLQVESKIVVGVLEQFTKDAGQMISEETVENEVNLPKTDQLIPEADQKSDESSQSIESFNSQNSQENLRRPSSTTFNSDIKLTNCQTPLKNQQMFEYWKQIQSIVPLTMQAACEDVIERLKEYGELLKLRDTLKKSVNRNAEELAELQVFASNFTQSAIEDSRAD